ncbi:alginate export family protein [Algoriphagus sp. A40]|uniref:alginate export family protein n=1 Tax=Algoriphagus sp. A40 TaxID=1945863 RepID=UPI0011158F64|nr:alginate export family protein [Algoriphagus sp. A40]
MFRCGKVTKGGIGAVAIFLASFGDSFSQQADSVKNQLNLDFEIRPRGEFRNHFQLTAADSITPEFFISQRNRLTLGYRSKVFDLVAAFQEIHLWNKSGEPSSVANVNFFELYLQPKFGKFSVRLGRQRLLLDNGRIFSDAPWAQQSRSHEGIRLFYSTKNVVTDFSWMFTRTYSSRYDPMYSPVASHRYVNLVLHHLKAKLSNQVTLTTVLALDTFENSEKGQNGRYTTGGRIEYLKGKFYLTLNGFYQAGKTVSGQPIHAYYLQPELRVQVQNTTLRLGSEILSGNDLAKSENTFKSFVPLYGVAWKFMGNMNFFTRFPGDVNSSGLVNPYIFVLHRINSKLGIRADWNIFYNQYPMLNDSKNTVEKYLGNEFDLSLNYRPAAKWEVNFGLSILIPTESMVLLNKIENTQETPIWSYLMVSYRPSILSGKSIF